MAVDRTELADILAEATGWSVSADLAVLAFPIFEALGPFEGSRGYMNGADLTVHE